MGFKSEPSRGPRIAPKKPPFCNIFLFLVGPVDLLETDRSESLNLESWAFSLADNGTFPFNMLRQISHRHPRRSRPHSFMIARWVFGDDLFSNRNNGALSFNLWVAGMASEWMMANQKCIHLTMFYIYSGCLPRKNVSSEPVLFVSLLSKVDQ